MTESGITIDFNEFSLTATLFDTPIARRFAKALPVTVVFTRWGGEMYGSIGRDLGEETPVADIPEGGIAYTSRGNYVCIFFGQRPAWPVDHIGQIDDARPLSVVIELLEQVATDSFIIYPNGTS
ncbi:MAG: cyclophilin-like fold protein [Thermodesulfobacteriota bacterium]|nr:cyclophilin-like fold protein [Thermodesulfobacteriota bacterium]